jgi:hypothetical protein
MYLYYHVRQRIASTFFTIFENIFNLFFCTKKAPTSRSRWGRGGGCIQKLALPRHPKITCIQL